MHNLPALTSSTLFVSDSTTDDADESIIQLRVVQLQQHPPNHQVQRQQMM